MLVREYTDGDFDRIKQLHAESGFEYRLPPLSSKEFFSRRVIEDNNSVGMATFLRKSAEVYLICDPSWRTPAWRNEAIRQLQLALVADARQHEVKQLVAFLPPQVTRSFGRRLQQHGWTTYQGVEWRCVSKEID